MFQDNLGNGAFGSVYLAKYRQEMCAAKMLGQHARDMIIGFKQGPEKYAKRDLIKKECSFLESLHHENIVQHITTIVEPKANLPVLVMELMDCNLKQFILDHKPLDHQRQLTICHGVSSGLQYLHSQNIIHRDLCDDNILLKQSPNLTVKISDFGMSRVLKHNSMSISLSTVGHRQGYLPPEGQEDSGDEDTTEDDKAQYSHHLDIYSLGAIATQVIQSANQFKSRRALRRTFKQIPEAHPLKNIIAKCIDKNTTIRPEAGFVCGYIVAILNMQS